MHAGRLILAQFMDALPTHEFNRCVDRYRGNYKTSRFSCRDHFLSMAFAQLTYRESLRDIQTCLRAVQPKLYHAGFRARMARNTLAKANENRDCRIWQDLATVLIARARALYLDDPIGIDLKQTVYAFDSTTIDLCMKLFPWAQFRRHKSAVKLHTLLDIRGNIPCFVHVSSGKMADVTSLDFLPLEPGAFYVFDKGYNDFARLYRFTREMAFFVTRAKHNLDYHRRSWRCVDKSTGVRSDQTVVLCGPKSSERYPAPLRKVAYYAEDLDKRFVFLTNNFSLPPLTIAQLYKSRWRVELFFKWIKQNLRIKAFYGTSINAVKTQVWIALCVYVLVAIIRKEFKSDLRMSEILQILSISLFENMPILQAFSQTSAKDNMFSDHNQLSLFDL
jgi:hypothetical protein